MSPRFKSPRFYNARKYSLFMKKSNFEMRYLIERYFSYIENKEKVAFF